MMIDILMVQPLFIGTTELLLIGGMALLLFGGKKLPEMMRGLGQGVKEFKEGMNEVKAPLDEEASDDNSEEDDGNTQKEGKRQEDKKQHKANGE